MTSVRLTPRTTGPVQVQVHHAAPRALPVKAVDGFEQRKSQAIQRGMMGPVVTQLQQRLVAAKFMSQNDFKSGPGVYGPRTEAAVKCLQAHVGLPVTGIAAPSTRAALAGGAKYQPVREPEATTPMSLAAVHAKLSETFTDEVTQPMGCPLGT